MHNLGTGKGYSVLDMVAAFEKATEKKVKCQVVERRDGDIRICFADPKHAEVELNWKSEEDIHSMCEDTWCWQLMNPDGCWWYQF